MVNITLYYANWCGHCINFKPEWNKLKDTIGGNSMYSNIETKEFEQTKDNDIMEKEGIKGYPTIRINGKDYNGERSVSAILEKAIEESQGVNQKGGSIPDDDIYYKQKYLKYKTKYLKLLAELSNE